MTTTPDIGETIVSARPLAEYVAMFDLDDEALGRRPILDCPGGASSFAAEVRARGGEVTSVDPLYALPPEVFAARARADVRRSNRFVRDNIERYVWPFFSSLDDPLARRGAGCERFIADRTASPDAYVAAALPTLPFADDAFALVLSSHLMFSYADRLDHGFHLDALRELARVCAGEVRVYPLVDVGAAPYPRLADLRETLLAEGLNSELRRVPYEFQRGADRMLVLTSG